MDSPLTQCRQLARCASWRVVSNRSEAGMGGEGERRESPVAEITDRPMRSWRAVRPYMLPVAHRQRLYRSHFREPRCGLADRRSQETRPGSVTKAFWHSFNNLGNLGEMFRDTGRTYGGDGRSQESQAVPRLLVFS